MRLMTAGSRHLTSQCNVSGVVENLGFDSVGGPSAAMGRKENARLEDLTRFGRILSGPAADEGAGLRSGTLPDPVWLRAFLFEPLTNRFGILRCFELADQLGAAVPEDVVVDGPRALGADHTTHAELSGLG